MKRKNPCIITPESGLSSKVTPKIHREPENLYDNNGKPIKVPKKQFRCYNCKKNFSRMDSMKRHIANQICFTESQLSQIEELLDQFNVFKEEQRISQERIEKMQRRIDDLERENDKLKSGNSVSANTVNMVNGDVNTTINKNIVVVYDKVDRNKIGDDKLIPCFRKGFQSPIYLTNAVHFDEDIPENHSVFISGMKSRYAMIYTDNNWNLILKEDVIDKIYNDSRNYIEDNMERFYDKITPSQKRALHRWLDIDDEEDDRIIRIKDSIKLLLYNKRHIPEKTKKLMEA